MLASEGSVGTVEVHAVGVRRQVGRLPGAGRREPRQAEPALPAGPRRHRRVPATAGVGSRPRRPPRHSRRRGGRTRRVGCAQLRRDAEPRTVHPPRVLGVRHPVSRRPIAVARQVLRSSPPAGSAGRRGRADRAGPAARGRPRGVGVRPQAALGGCGREETRLRPISRGGGRRRGSRTRSGTPRRW